jgi:hypothetical protein
MQIWTSVCEAFEQLNALAQHVLSALVVGVFDPIILMGTPWKETSPGGLLPEKGS